MPTTRVRGRQCAPAASGDLLLFLDADLRQLRPEQVDALIAPILGHRAEMSVGSFRGGHAVTDFAQRVSPNLSGQRCLYRETFLAVPLVDGSRSGVEIALTIHARACHMAMVSVPLAGVSHPLKEEKLGVLRGVFARGSMYLEILLTVLRYHFAVRFPGHVPLSTRLRSNQ